MGSVTLNDFERDALRIQEMLAPYVAQNKRLMALLREAIEFAELMIDNLMTRPDDASVHEVAGAIEDWRRRAKAEVGG